MLRSTVSETAQLRPYRLGLRRHTDRLHTLQFSHSQHTECDVTEHRTRNLYFEFVESLFTCCFFYKFVKRRLVKLVEEVTQNLPSRRVGLGLVGRH